MTCAKKTVICTIQVNNITVSGVNWCENPQTECPRLPGEDYTKCQTICQQSGHAEINAINEAKKQGLDLKGSIATIKGHCYVCRSCGHALKDAGVDEIYIKL